ncbi:hypothetical protein OC844_004321 [Tilletia horrida]|nr:hypothetical protein OC844_004321 [Tilletia horrida]
MSTRSYALARGIPGKSAVPASAPAGVSSTPTPAEALEQHSQTSADELEPIADQTRAHMSQQAKAAASQGRSEEVAESRPTVEEAKAEHAPIDIRKAAPNLARKTGQA